MTDSTTALKVFFPSRSGRNCKCCDLWSYYVFLSLYLRSLFLLSIERREWVAAGGLIFQFFLDSPVPRGLLLRRKSVLPFLFRTEHFPDGPELERTWDSSGVKFPLRACFPPSPLRLQRALDFLWGVSCEHRMASRASLLIFRGGSFCFRDDLSFLVGRNHFLSESASDTFKDFASAGTIGRLRTARERVFPFEKRHGVASCSDLPRGLLHVSYSTDLLQLYQLIHRLRVFTPPGVGPVFVCTQVIWATRRIFRPRFFFSSLTSTFSPPLHSQTEIPFPPLEVQHWVAALKPKYTGQTSARSLPPSTISFPELSAKSFRSIFFFSSSRKSILGTSPDSPTIGFFSNVTVLQPQLRTGEQAHGSFPLDRNPFPRPCCCCFALCIRKVPLPMHVSAR